MGLTTKEALFILQNANITECKDQQVLLKWIREGKIKANKQSKRSGYRIDQNDLMLFIERNRPPNKINILKEYDLLKEENNILKNKGEDTILLKNLSELRVKMGRLIAENQQLKNELSKLKSQNK
jgi:hypothetical protein